MIRMTHDALEKMQKMFDICLVKSRLTTDGSQIIWLKYTLEMKMNFLHWTNNANESGCNQ